MGEILAEMIDPDRYFQGKIVILAPHMDDEALACGGLIARVSRKDRIHIIYATDGMKSPAPVVPGSDSISPDLGETRVQESIAAMTFLGVPEGNLRFLRLPEAGLKKNSQAWSRCWPRLSRPSARTIYFSPSATTGTRTISQSIMR